MVVDLLNVPMAGVTSSLTLESSIEKGLKVFTVKASKSVKKRLDKLRLFDDIPSRSFFPRGLVALRQAIDVMFNTGSNGLTSTHVHEAASTPSVPPCNRLTSGAEPK